MGKKREVKPSPQNGAKKRRARKRSPWLFCGMVAASASMTFRVGAESRLGDYDLAPKKTELRWELPFLRQPGWILEIDQETLVARLEYHALLDRVPGDQPVAGRPATAPAVQPDGAQAFDIPPGAFDAVLDAFGEATDLDFDLAVAGILQLASPGVSGRLTVEHALERILEGTGVAYRFIDHDTVRLDLEVIEDSVDVVGHRSASSPKVTEPLRDTPLSITVIPEDVIEQQGVTTLRDALRNVTGISLQAGEGGVPAGDNLTIRGFSARTDLFIDGVRDIGGYTRDPFNVEQIEVTKGPSATYSGRGSTGGSINLVTKSAGPGDSLGSSVALGTDSFSRATVDFNKELDQIEGGALRVNAMWTGGETPGRDEVESQRWGLAPSISLGLGTPTQARISYFHLDQDNVPDYGIPWVPANNEPLADLANQGSPVAFSNFYGLNERDYEKTRTSVGTIEVDHMLGSHLSLRNLTRYGETRRDSIITAPRFASTESTDIRRTDMKSRDQTDGILANQTDLTASFRTGSLEHRVVTGVELAYETSENFAREEMGVDPPNTDLFHPNPNDPYIGFIARTGEKTDVTARSTALYAFDTVEIAPKWQASVGLRWDRFDLDYESATLDTERVDEKISWRAGMVYKPRPQGSLYFGAGTSFNPSAEGLSLRSTLVEADPEESRSYELGTKWDLLESRVSFTAALFDTEKINARTPGLDPEGPPNVLDGKERVRGFEMGLSGQVTNRWYSWFGYTYMDSEVIASNTNALIGNEFGNTPKHSASLWTTYRVNSSFEIGAGAHFVGDRFSNSQDTRLAPSYWLSEAMVSYRVNDQLTLRLNGSNLADEKYIDRVGGGHFIPGPGRTISLTTTFSR